MKTKHKENSFKYICILIAFLLFAAVVNAQEYKVLKNPSGIKTWSIQSLVIDSTMRVIDTVYSVDDNKAVRVIQTFFKKYPYKEEMLIRYKEFWDDKQKIWSFYSVSLSPYKENSSTGFIINRNFQTTPYFSR